MAVLIEGMEMPKEGFVEIIIRDDGTVQQTGQSYRIDGTDYYTPYIGEMPVMYKAVPVPPHGRLIDASVAYDKIAEQEGGNYVDMDAVGMGLDETPTVIPASEEE